MADEARGGAKDRAPRDKRAEDQLTAALHAAGWKVRAPSRARERFLRADLVAERGGQRYVVELKTAPEGRADRIVPLWAQACLQAVRSAGGDRPLAVVAAPRIPFSAAESLLEFAAKYAPDVGVGILDFCGLRRFRGEGLEELDADPPSEAALIATTARPAAVFSDLNQWLLKVLLAPELPEKLLSAPRERYRNPSELARAAGVSTMSAYRFAHAMENEGFLDTSGRTLRLVQRKRLFSGWRAVAHRPKELPMRLLVGTGAEQAAARLAASADACLGLFAAADALNLGFVSGVPPYVYVRDLEAVATASGNLVPAEPYEAPDLFLREARAAESVFRGVVEREGVHVSDVLQVWVDVAAHPSRGKEQADLIRQNVLQPLFRPEMRR